MATTNYTSLLGLALPTQGDLSGQWGNEVNNYITTYLDSAIAGQLAISLTGNLTLTKATGTSLSSTSSQYAILNVTPSASTWTITVPAASQIYHINNLSSTHTFTIKASGQTGFVVAAAEKCVVAYNGTDFVRVGSTSVFGAPSTAMTLDASGNLLVGETSAKYSAANRGLIEVNGTSSALLGLSVNNTAAGYLSSNGVSVSVGAPPGYNILFDINGEKMRLDSSGNLLVGKTVTSDSTVGNVIAPTYIFATRDGAAPLNLRRLTDDGEIVTFFSRTNGGVSGTISITSTTTAYNTSSDYRLKENIQPMQNALAKVDALKPVTYNWKLNGSDGEGFIAHELAEVCPHAVTGEKDAVNEDGSIKSQGIDTSFLVATLTAALQEAHSLIKDLQIRVSQLEAK